MTWPPKRVAEMCEWIADGFSMKDVARLMKVPPSTIKREWEKVKAELGPQAR